MINAHERYEELLPLFVAGQLDDAGQSEIELHLIRCAACQADLALWRALSAEIKAANQATGAPPNLVETALNQMRSRPNLLRRAWQLLRVQTFLVQPELWPASAGVMALGVVLALLAEKSQVIYFLAPLIAAACLALIYGPENDPAIELALATPTSPWKILLARLTLVFGYNLLLALVASLLLVMIVPPVLLGSIILSWLSPLTFLSALALLLSLWIGSGKAVMISYSLWLAQYVQPVQAAAVQILSPAWETFFSSYRDFWHSPILLFVLALLLLGVALVSAGRSPKTLSRQLV
jgi:hypothetical protein